MIKDILKKNRSYRRYDASCRMERAVLTELVDNTRYAAASVNLQPFKYKIICESPLLDDVFAITRWAKALPNYNGPESHERPTAFIIICQDTSIAPNIEAFQKDVGIVSQTILISAAEKGFGGCMINNFSRAECSAICSLPENLSPVMVLAVGKPAEEIVITEPDAGGSITYYRDENGVHHVPKRRLEDILIG